ncbi:MAG TPA: hypothetical protein VGM39_13535 [Kofleriaceae bacterium]|jgi:hypothetical protein
MAAYYRKQVYVGLALLLGGLVFSAISFRSANTSGGMYVVAIGPIATGLVIFIRAAIASTPKERRDPRQLIYGVLDLILGVAVGFLIARIVPNRLPSATVHLWTLPLSFFAMGAGTVMGGELGWKTAVIAGTVCLASTVLVIVRILISAAFLSGVYGAFGRAAAMTAVTGVFLLVELVGLLPIAQVKWLMSRAGRRAFGVPFKSALPTAPAKA